MPENLSKDFWTEKVPAIFERLYLFYGLLSDQGYVLEITGKVFGQTEISSGNLIGHKFSEIIFWQAEACNSQLIGEALEKLNANQETGIHLNFRLNSREKLPVEVTFCQIENSENVFVCGLEKRVDAGCQTVVNSNGDSPDSGGSVKEITDAAKADRKHFEIIESEKKARDIAEEANRSKDFFIAFVSHELRSPLNAILGWVKILLSKEVDENTRRGALETIERSARAQAQLINDLVDSARVTSGKLKLEFRPLDLVKILRNVIASQTPTAESKKIEMLTDFQCDNPNIFGDNARLQQVFSNLISNALKFTPENGTINISLQCADQLLKIEIKDTGQGISSAALPNIFRQFSQADETTSRDTSGLGLGLSIVKILIEKHGGSVTAHSDGIGRGATFTVVLPQTEELKAENSKPKNSKETDFKPLSDLTIFVIEDDPDSNEILALFLNQYGAKTITSMSAREAFEKYQAVENEPPHLIISDLGMPEEDGYSLLRRIRSLPESSGGSVPAIALSAFSSNDNKREAYESGFQKYHTKPFEPDLLIEQIIELINNSK